MPSTFVLGLPVSDFLSRGRKGLAVTAQSLVTAYGGNASWGAVKTACFLGRYGVRGLLGGFPKNCMGRLSSNFLVDLLSL